MRPKGVIHMLQSNRYHYAECGLDNIYLVNGFEYVETPRGSGVMIQNLEGLHLAIGRMLVRERRSLRGKEFRFLRHELNLTQQNLALILGVNVQGVAQWEKDKPQNGIPGPAQRLIRLLYEEHTKGNKKIMEPLKRLAELDEIMNDGIDDDIDFVDTKEGWQPSLMAA